MGRKPSSNPKNEGYRLRLNKEEKRELDVICQTVGIKRSVYIRRALDLMKERGLSDALKEQIKKELEDERLS